MNAKNNGSNIDMWPLKISSRLLSLSDLHHCAHSVRLSNCQLINDLNGIGIGSIEETIYALHIKYLL